MIGLLSIILDLLFNFYIKNDSFFLSLFTIISIIFLKKDDKYLYKVFLLGIIYDLIFTNYFILDGIIFLLLGFICKLFYSKFKDTIISNLIIGLIIILLYQLILFIIFRITNYNILSFNEFIFIIKHFFISNIIYIVTVSIIRIKKKV